jgi:uncharacterized membrane protein
MMYRMTSLGLNIRLERMLAYAFWWLSGLILFFVERNRSVRWHAAQSMITFGTLSIIMAAVSLLKFMLSIIPLLSLLTNFGLGLLLNILWWAGIILWIWLIAMAGLQSENGPDYRLPFVSGWVNRLV